MQTKIYFGSSKEKRLLQKPKSSNNAIIAATATIVLAFSIMLVSGYGYAMPSLLAYATSSGSGTTPPPSGASGVSGLSGTSGSSSGKAGTGGASTSVTIGHATTPPPPPPKPKPKPTGGGSSGSSGGSSSGSSGGAKYCNPSGCKGDPGYYTKVGHHHCYDGYPGCICTSPSKCGVAYGKT